MLHKIASVCYTTNLQTLFENVTWIRKANIAKKRGQTKQVKRNKTSQNSFQTSFRLIDQKQLNAQEEEEKVGKISFFEMDRWLTNKYNLLREKDQLNNWVIWVFDALFGLFKFKRLRDRDNERQDRSKARCGNQL